MILTQKKIQEPRATRTFSTLAALALAIGMTLTTPTLASDSESCKAMARLGIEVAKARERGVEVTDLLQQLEQMPLWQDNPKMAKVAHAIVMDAYGSGRYQSPSEFYVTVWETCRRELR